MQLIWLDGAEERRWLALNQRSHYTVFASFMLFSMGQALALRLLGRRRKFASPAAVARSQHGSMELVHSLACVAAAAYLLLYHPPPACAGRLFCFDPLPFRMMDVHAGFLVFELVFFHNNSSILRPTFPTLRFHHVLLIIAYFLCKAYPCALTLQVLPMYQLLAAAQGAHALFQLAVGLRQPVRLRLTYLTATVVLSFLRMVAAAVLPLHSWRFISDADLWNAELPHDRSLFNGAYCGMMLGGGFVLAIVYLGWLSAAISVMRSVHEEVRKQQPRAAASAGPGKGAKAGGSTKKNRRRA